MDDLISRQAAIDALDGKFNITGRKNAETIRDYINGVNKKLRELPSAERTGRWEKIELYAPSGDYVMFQCSECASLYFETSSHCPNCGAKMEAAE